MLKKIIVLVLLGHMLTAQADPASSSNDALTLKLDNALANMAQKRSPKLSSAIALIYDERTTQVLYSKNAEIKSPIASISKLMTAMVVLDAKLPMDEVITISREDIDTLKNTHSRLRPGMQFTRGELLKVALMASENRAAAALARTYPGGTEAAVAKMNQKARELGMNDTRFLDPTGLNSGNVSTAQDLVKMVLAAQEYDPIHQATTSASHEITPAGYRYRPLMYRNTNPLVKSAAWDIRLSKTGYINEAGRCLVMKANFNERPMVIVLLDSWGKRTRLGDANRIRKWIESALTHPAHVTRRG